ncbi:Clan CA, family C40, NlpC/P60 superfamily cysteine peptidase [Trichomonas vaginalis G3]|uniref:Clan CA, family C40, NlpC/P60 superfamily cysteine peptidase n=1 Tax=Trichomonas vaginalis (strain ATCC PRA-98 / G3) TaxID=412133 RepID=A2DVE3_TRIV3|nr:Clan CA, family C40, NlpC/P60 superfamily cysteine peptidase [Trichomonas vaginalis G3]|eukprot:XP_001327845.1 Clan CA, family C40, NlpC/P60 superfamily cysteine peptidase [Trichomonas vaginalis G3]
MFGLLFTLACSRRTHYHHRSTNGVGDNILAVARSKQGCPYVWGGNGPSQFDCSGLVKFCHNACGINNIARVAADQARGGRQGSGAAGDVAYYGWPAYHVGVCCGDGGMIHAPKPGDVVKYLAFKWWAPSGYRRYW